MKTLLSLLAGLLITSTVGAQTLDYSQFKTNDEENNIEIFKSVSPSVVNITNSRLVRSFYAFNPQEVPQGSGTGFVWNEEGYIVTNYHVVQQADRVTDPAGRNQLCRDSGRGRPRQRLGRIENRCTRHRVSGGQSRGFFVARSGQKSHRYREPIRTGYDDDSWRCQRPRTRNRLCEPPQDSRCNTDRCSH